MPEALVCINTLKTCREVQEAFRVHGVYDVVARVKGESFEDLVNIVNRRIKRLSQVQTILSMLIIESEKPIRNDELVLI
jgi:DNA-binding Lrp family transcriptional regulator